MSGKLVRISEKAGRTLRALAARSGETMQAVLDEAIEEFRRKSLLRRANAAYAALRKNSKAWKAELRDRSAWEATNFDDLGDA
jgi:hypothetical protein